MYNKVELCGMNTAKLPVLTEAEKRELLARAHADNDWDRVLTQVAGGAR